MEIKTIFVFGSNLAGIHGAGAALWAKQHAGAQQGLGVGMQPGNNSYALPTKDQHIKTLSLEIIKLYVNQLIALQFTTKYIFRVTRIGCGLAGYRDKDIAPLFDSYITNRMYLPEEWRPWNPYHKEYWSWK